MNIICAIAGHKTVLQVATGKQYSYTDRLTGQTCIGNYMRVTRRKHCTRCGVVVHKEMATTSEDI